MRAQATRWKRATFVAVTLWACLVTSGCGPEEVVEEGALPEAPKVESPPRRIVSLAPSVTETLFALGVGDRVVGVTSFCDYPPEADALPKIGDFVQHDIERILELSPDLVILGMGPGDVLNTYRRLLDVSVPALVVRFDTLSDVFVAIDRIGVAVHRSAAAAELSSSLHREVDNVQALVSELPRPRVLYVYENTDFSLVVAGPDHYTSELIAVAGGENVAGDAKVKYPRQSIEWVLDQDPDVIISTTAHQDSPADPDRAVQELWSQWPGLKAVQNGRVHSQELVRPGPRLGEGLRALAALLHPGMAESLR
ncbi:MAG: helical backbone metal receptor [Planctomycetota bacterium]